MTAPYNPDIHGSAEEYIREHQPHRYAAMAAEVASAMGYTARPRNDYADYWRYIQHIATAYPGLVVAFSGELMAVSIAGPHDAAGRIVERFVVLDGDLREVSIRQRVRDAGKNLVSESVEVF